MAAHRTREEIDEDDARHFFGRYAGSVLYYGQAAYTLMPLRCEEKGCARVAVLIDPFAPFYTEQNRCSAHAPEEPRK